MPTLAFSEAMRDIGLLVGAAGITGDLPELERAGADLVPISARLVESFGWGEPTWTRRDALAQLPPKTAIAERCTLDYPWLVVVRGDGAKYRIHIRSAAVCVEPEYRFVCVVPNLKQPDRIFLPFEEHGGSSPRSCPRPSLQADDEHITDPEILNQDWARVNRLISVLTRERAIYASSVVQSSPGWLPRRATPICSLFAKVRNHVGDNPRRGAACRTVTRSGGTVALRQRRWLNRSDDASNMPRGGCNEHPYTSRQSQKWRRTRCWRPICSQRNSALAPRAPD
jgi:hypothetical protein